MKKTSLNEIINKLLIVFFIIQPIFDIKIFYNSISTLIRVIIIFGFFVYYFLTNKNKKKYYLIIYPFLIGIYFIFHHINAMKFTSLVPGNFNYSILKEALYFIKMISPFMLIYSIYCAHFSHETIINIMKYLVFVISSTIIISNLLEISYGSYSDIRIKANFFEWFNLSSEYSYQDLASKGLFEFANQISAILIMFLPFVIYNSLKTNKWTNWIILALNAFALILLCTKVSVLGIFVVFLYVLFAYGFIAFINKQYIKLSKQAVPILAIFLVYCILLPFNPMFGRMQERAALSENIETNEISLENTIINTIVEENTEDTATVEQIIVQDVDESNIQLSMLDEETVDLKIKYIEDNYKSKQLHEQFLLENYPYKYDPDFWYDFLQNDILLTTNYRFIELSMVKRVIEINNNPLDKWLGITNTRLQNIFNIEKDFVVQYYALRYNRIDTCFRTIFNNFSNVCL